MFFSFSVTRPFLNWKGLLYYFLPGARGPADKVPPRRVEHHRMEGVARLVPWQLLSAGIFSRRTNQTHEAQVYSHDGPIRHRKHRYILTTDQSDT
eukprot:189312-Prorocentrum_minimum.AAC.1